MTIRYAWRLVMRNPRRTATYLFGLALAVGLFTGILFFVDATARQMTATALAPVKLDLVAHATTPDVNLPDLLPVLQKQRDILSAEPLAAADFVSASKAGSTQLTPAGRLFALKSSYLASFDVLQLSQGTLAPDGAVISEALAQAQSIRVGDAIQLTFAGLRQPVTLPVTGIMDMSNAGALFATATENENAVVADVVFVDLDWFQAHLGPQLAPLVRNPPPSLPAGAIVLDPQVHIRIDRAHLPADPARAALVADALRRQVERQFPGQIKVVNNLAGGFKTAQADVLAAQILFIFLGLPGVVLAAYLAKYAAELFAEAQRREIGLLRTRGATPGQITGIVAFAAVLLAAGGSLLGVIFGALILFISTRGAALPGLNPLAAGFDWAMFGRSVGAALLAGLLLTFLAAFLPTFGALQREITQERRMVRRQEKPPFWKRAYLDGLLLAAAAVVLIVTRLTGGFKPSGNEGTAISLSFYVFLAPLFAWVGLTLLTLRAVESGLSAATRPIAAFFGRLFGEIGEVAGKSVSRRAARVGAASTVIALTLSFGISLTLFQHTYMLEKQRDAQYVVGADVRFTPALNSPQPAGFAAELAKLSGVQAVTAVARDTQALVGSEKNTVYGIDLATFRQTAYLPDSFFVDAQAAQTLEALRQGTANYAPGSAAQTLDALAKTRNGVLISVEQAQKYNILPGDPVLLRLYNRGTQQYTQVTAQTVGLFTYFPTSSQDSDFILNRDFMTASSGNPVMDYFLLKTSGQPGVTQSIAGILGARYRDSLPARVVDTATVIKADESSLASLNLDGLGTMERLYTLLVASAGLGIFLSAMISERQREFGAMRALGANLSQLRRFLFAEAATIGGLSLVIGGVVGALLARLLVTLLATIFTIPPSTLVWPAGQLLALAGLVVAGMVASALLSARRLATMRVVEVLREL